MKLTTLFLAVSTLVTMGLSQTTTSFDAAAYSSASAAALAADGKFIFDVLVDLNSRYTQYITYMDNNGMAFPEGVANYINRILTISSEGSLLAFIQTRSFPFSEFQTLMPAFPWYSSLLSEAGVTTFYVPEDFLTGTVGFNVAFETGTVSSSLSLSSDEVTSSLEFSSLSSAISSVAVNSTLSSAVLSTSSSPRTNSSTFSSISSSASSSSSSSSSQGSASSLYIPVLAAPLFLVSLLF
ncbi:hypothetical protein BON22_3677 [Cyberlindnera fabianii]|uniref:Uncharacterized protein n=1 Tax=Cyberlindnera fabianii TaxID=36022 RepID=A0A1V2L3A9_CYBFA|nr:hypothetical protein BON22_3677 [Cyberlindnera fabianii]